MASGTIDRHDFAMLRSLPVDVAFLAGIVSDDALIAAVEAARAGGGLPHEILIQRGAIGRHGYLVRLAASLGARFDDLHGARVPPDWVGAAVDGRAGRTGCVRLDIDGVERLVVAPRGQTVLRLIAARERAGAPMTELVLTTPAALWRVCLAARPQASVDHALRMIERASPGASVAGFGASARIAAAALLVGLAALVWLMPQLALATLAVGGSLLFLAAAGLRIEALALASGPPPAPTAGPYEACDYTILVPLRGERAVIRQLFAALDALAWPAERKHVVLLVEADDAETLRAVAENDPGERFTTLALPPGGPRTKPRALQFGLIAAADGLLTIYDAEDEPAPDQLSKAATAFATAPRALACVQARLAIHNGGANWRTRQFALEYAALFEVMLPGLAATERPVPLGGTSNHFRVEALRAVGGWDPWNVTEDAELGLRLARRGYRVGTISSHTEEEAPLGMRAWLGQRTRWYKGWLATIAMMATRPLATARELKPGGIVAVAGLMAGSLLAALFYPVAIGVPFASLLYADGGSPIDAVVFGVGIAAFVGGHGYSVLVLIAGARIAGLRLRAADVALLPVYWLICSFAAWRAVAEFVIDPSGWSKTGHVGRAAAQPAMMRRSAAAARVAPWPVSKVETNRPAESSR